MGGTPSQLLGGSGFYSVLSTDTSGFFNQERTTIFLNHHNLMFTVHYGMMGLAIKKVGNLLKTL